MTDGSFYMEHSKKYVYHCKEHVNAVREYLNLASLDRVMQLIEDFTRRDSYHDEEFYWRLMCRLWFCSQ